jgi:hypothetical protein
MKQNNKVMENRMRRALSRWGERLIKSRVRFKNLDDLGGYMIIDVSDSAAGHVVAGARFDLTLDDVAKYVEDKQATGKR